MTYRLMIIACFILTSCTKVVQLDLRTAPPVYVIEGNVTDQPGPYTVQITQTTGFYQQNVFPGVAGATVTIGNGEGFSELLTDKGNGQYSTQSLQGIEGNTYWLSVIIGKDTFAGSSTMPHRINLDSVYITTANNSGKNVLVAVPSFLNPAGTPYAYYFFNQWIDGYLDKTLYYSNSQYSGGQVNSFPLERVSEDSTLHTGDTVRIEMQCIDQPMYDYWSDLDASATGSGSAYPGNPPSNLSGGALGYFSAHTSQTKGIRVH